MASRVQELPDDFDDKIDLNKAPAETHGPAPPPAAGDSGLSFDMMMEAAAKHFPAKKDAPVEGDPSQAGAALPPGMATARQYTADEMWQMLNKSPLFMTELDETGEDGGENIALEAIKALAYEGTRAENAASFREQGNENARLKRWKDAREFYDRALGALKLPQKRADAEEGDDDIEHDLVELDEEEEARKEKEHEEASLVNRALCNLELKNYGSCNRDCAAALKLNPMNVKAYYRSGMANFHLDKLPAAIWSCNLGLKIDPTNKSLLILQDKIAKRRTQIERAEREQREREEKARREKETLALALKGRKIATRSTTTAPPQLEDAAIQLEDPNDASSTLSFPCLLLYPLHSQTDFIKSFAEDESVGQHLEYIFPLPWDEDEQYLPENVECYIETKAGGLVKAGKKMALLRILNTGKVEIVDSLLRINVVPKNRAQEWVDNFKKIKAATK
ncbi:TPR repeat protein-like protein [Aureobasidium sp. EXF-12298]|nr:TPR repeat protein-like protein [Aureobasidium sp. EXF-12298]KAI4752837.1 TPR repeat protein-like protein [Aureobasidium sp. EXF-12344]KAI4769376.1 TPR repeat protein-like protein [Aureobasidium sp. EXF-3400]